MEATGVVVDPCKCCILFICWNDCLSLILGIRFFLSGENQINSDSTAKSVGIR